MAVDIYSTSDLSISPRFSFSNDLKHEPDHHHRPIDPMLIRSDHLLLSPTFDFDFCTTSNLTPADELFSNGKILPTDIKNPQINHLNYTRSKSNKSTNPNLKYSPKKRLKELIEDRDPDQLQNEKEKSSVRSLFWQFRRSASLNCDNGKGPKGLLRSLSIRSLLRSSSTGSALNPKLKVAEKPKDSVFLRSSSSSSSSHVYYSYRNSKSCRGGNGITIIPILNIPPAINFFGFGSLFCNGKIKKKTKSS